MDNKWHAATIGALLEDEGGSIQTGPFGTKLKAAEYTPSGVPVISVGEVDHGRLVVHEDTPRVDESVTKRLPQFVLREGDVVFGRKGAVERSARVRKNEDGWFLGSDGIRIRLPKTCDTTFIAYQLQRPAHREWMLQHAAGTTMPSLNESIIRSIPIVIPPLQVQRAIAAMLASLDEKIEQNRRTSRALEELARAIFRAWFVDFEPVKAKAAGARAFPSMPQDIFNSLPTRLVESPLGSIPAGWQPKILGDLIFLEYGKPLKAEDRKQGNVPVYGSNGQVGCHDVPIVDRPGIVVGRKGNPGTVERVSVPFFPIDTTFYVSPKENAPPSAALFYMLASSNLARLTADSAVPGLNRNIAYGELCILAPREVTVAFATIIDPVHALIDTIGKESRKLAELRDYLLPKLLSGTIRVKS